MASVDNVKSSFKKIIKRFLIVFFALLIGLGVWLYFGTYSKGVRAGVIMKVSQKGFLFKTYEGQLNIQGFGAVKSSNQFSETFSFSVEDHEVEIIKALEEVSLSGERINLSFKERYVVLPWRGDTKYFVTGIERKKEMDATDVDRNPLD